MKKILLLLIVLTAFSCSKEETDCKCDAKYTIDGVSYYYVNNQPINCETGQPFEYVGGGFFVKCN